MPLRGHPDRPIDRPASVPMSLPRTFVIALDNLALDDGHTNRSAIVRKLVEREIRQKIGDNWREILVPEQVA